MCMSEVGLRGFVNGLEVEVRKKKDLRKKEDF